ncbi:MAG: hypothetical protein NTY35_03865 [Planctomycetota bacterium]|nr:hypothetical protein [Planctomycetota bacterium]
MQSKLLGICVLLLAAACQSVGPDPAHSSGRDCVFLQLKSGPRSASISKEEAQKVFEGHFANMQRLAQEHKLLVAGPYGAPKRDPDLRGLFILAPAEIAEAEALAATDPGVIAGVFRTECVRMRTRAPLDAYIEHELAIEAQAKAEGRVRAPGEGGRPYVVLTAEDGRRARQALLGLDGVLLWGEFADGRALAFLDAKDLDACQTLLGDRAGRIGPYVLDPWFGSGELVKLPQMAR